MTIKINPVVNKIICHKKYFVKINSGQQILDKANFGQKNFLSETVLVNNFFCGENYWWKKKILSNF